MCLTMSLAFYATLYPFILSPVIVTKYDLRNTLSPQIVH